MAYSETDLDYSLINQYDAYVWLTVTKDDGTIVTNNGMEDYSLSGFASVELDFAGEADTTYTGDGEHAAILTQWDYDYSPPYQTFYYDPWDFNFFEGQGVYEPWSYYFLSPVYEPYHSYNSFVSLGETFDSDSTTVPATTCLVTYMNYFNKAKDYGGPQGRVNEVTPISTAWNALKRASDATVVVPDSQVRDGKGNVYQKYNQTSTIKNLTLVGTISISSSPDSEKKLRFTKP